jgi:hypothetical protein
LSDSDLNWLKIANNADLSTPGATSFSFAFWIYTSGTDVNTDVAFKVGAGEDWMYRIDILSDNTFRFQIAGVDLSYPSVSSGTNTITPTVWHFCTAEFQVGVGLSVMVNNSGLQSTAYTLNNIASGAFDFTSCQRTLGAETARIDEMLFMKRVLTAAERAYLYNSGAGRTLYP